jgi:hypothetical protein
MSLEQGVHDFFRLRSDGMESDVHHLLSMTLEKAAKGPGITLS